MHYNLMRKQILKWKCVSGESFVRSIYLKPAFLEGWKCTTLRVGSSGSAFCRNYQSNKGKTMQKLTGTMTLFIIFSVLSNFAQSIRIIICMLNYVNCNYLFFSFLIPKSQL